VTKACDESNPPPDWWHWFSGWWTRATLAALWGGGLPAMGGAVIWLWISARDASMALDRLAAKQSGDHAFQAAQLNELLADVRKMQTERSALVLDFDRRVTLNTEQVRSLTERVARLEQQRRADAVLR